MYLLLDKFQEYDIVGSRGKLGKELKNMWGFAICMGAVLFRSTANVGKRICIFSYIWCRAFAGRVCGILTTGECDPRPGEGGSQIQV